jgi:hypothetical protein
MTIYKTLFTAVLSTSLLGCISAAPQNNGYKGTDAVSLIAGEHNAINVVGGESTTVRILEVNGVSTGAGRFNAGSVIVSPGIKRISVRLWGHAPGYGAQGAEAFTCITLGANAGATYLISGSITSREYVVSIHDKSRSTDAPVLQVPVNFTQKLPSGGCNSKESI